MVTEKELQRIGFDSQRKSNLSRDPRLLEFINIKLAALGQPTVGGPEQYPTLAMSHDLLADYREKSRLLADTHSPISQRVQDFLEDYLAGCDPEGAPIPDLPTQSFVLDRHGLARALSLPPDADEHHSPLLDTYRIHQGILNNPRSDRRTTAGVFHVAEDGLPIPWDKKAVPRLTFKRLFAAALNPPGEVMRLPFAANLAEPVEIWVSLLLRPLVCPAMPGILGERTMEIRFFVPGSLVSNLDFVESIFGNGGDPHLLENDASLDPLRWTGHTGCVLLAPHLVGVKKKDLGLPHASEATERQKRDAMCWEDPEEPYNDGSAFKITARDSRGVVVTLIADNYYGYCKKEVKTQISFSANLLGLAEEEHAGGALAFPAYDLGESFQLRRLLRGADHTWEEVVKRHCDRLDVIEREGYAVDRNYPDIFYVPGDARFSLQDQKVSWVGADGTAHQLQLLAGHAYVLPSGYRIEMMRPSQGRRWRLVGTVPEPANCHKPCTVSGGGKSEISKSIADAIITGPVFVADFEKDFDRIEEIANRDLSDRFADPGDRAPDRRKILDENRSLGSVVKLLTPSSEFTDEYNEWLRGLPTYLTELLLVVKRFYKPDWGRNWRERFSVDSINGVPGNELKYRDRKMVSAYLRVGYAPDGSWRTFSLRKDFSPAFKIQTQDDITASVLVPANRLRGMPYDFSMPSVKFVRNCEYRLFQRPDDAVVRGYDHQGESDLAGPGNFISNFEPHDLEFARAMIDDAIRFDQFTEPMQQMVREFARGDSHTRFFVSSAHSRIVDGKPTKNPRYLQNRPDLEAPRSSYLAEIGTRLYRRIPEEDAVVYPVTAVLPGRRNNPPEPGVKPLCVYNPIHYMELPELFMEFVASITGKSPSTTGAGSEGALTKAPFNCLPPIIDLNNAFLAYALMDTGAFVTAAGYVGPKMRVAHDISLLVPEIWCRMGPEEQNPRFLIEDGHLERCTDGEHAGKPVLSSRLGYRITEKFVRRFFGRIFTNPVAVLTEEMLQPEKQDAACFAESMDTVVATHQLVARNYFQDGSIEAACPPLKSLLHIMAHGDHDGLSLDSPEFRKLFTRESVIASGWYQQRLDLRQTVATDLARRQVEAIEKFLGRGVRLTKEERERIESRCQEARERLEDVSSKQYRERIVGMLGIDPYTRADGE